MTAKEVAQLIQKKTSEEFVVVDRLDSEKQSQLRLKNKVGKFYIIAVLAEDP